MIAFLRKFEVLIFMALIVVVNFAFVYGIAHDFLPIGLYNLGRFLLLAGVLFAVVFVSRGTGAIIDVLRPMAAWRRHPGWYMFVVLIVPCVVVSFLVIKGLATGVGLSLVETNFNVISRIGVLRTVLIGALIGEVVWISYCLRQLRVHVSDYLAGLIVGAVWGLWWLPMAIYDIGIIPGLTFTTLLFAQASVGLLCAFVYAKTESGLLVFIMQFMVNAALLIFPIAPTTGGVETFQQYIFYYFACATLLFLLFGPRPLIGWRRNQAAVMRQ